MIRSTLATAVCVLALAALGTRDASPQPAPYEIHAILSTTGPAAFLGGEEAAGYAVGEDVVNQSGGINGQPVRFVVHDDASSSQNTVQLLSQLMTQKVPVVLGPTISAMCGATEPLVDRSGGPVLYCLSPTISPVNGDFAFSASTATKDFEPPMLRYALSRGWTRIAELNGTDATGQALEKAFDDVLQGPEGRNLQLVAREHFNPTDISVAAQVAQIKAQDPQLVFSFAAGTAFATVLRGLHDGGLNVPVIGAASNMVRSQLDEYAAFLPPELDFFVAGGVVLNPYAPRTVQEVQTRYFAAFKNTGKVPGLGSAVAWDTGMMIVDALRKVGTDATAAQLRDYLEQLHGWAGVFGVYDFTRYQHRGLGPDSIGAYRWDPAKHDFASFPVSARR